MKARRLTVRDLLDQRGKHQFAMLRVETLEKAEAAEKAGVELLSIPPAMIMNRRFPEMGLPAPQHLVDSNLKVVEALCDWLDQR